MRRQVDRQEIGAIMTLMRLDKDDKIKLCSGYMAGKCVYSCLHDRLG